MTESEDQERKPPETQTEPDRDGSGKKPPRKTAIGAGVPEPPKFKGDLPERNCYEILQIARDASEDEIVQAWRKAFSLNHPDLGGDKETAILLNQVKAILLHPDLRAWHDQFWDDVLTKRPVQVAENESERRPKTEDEQIKASILKRLEEDKKRQVQGETKKGRFAGSRKFRRDQS